MVDINLFDEEEEKSGKKEKDWDSTLGNSEGHKSDSLKDELNLDDDLGGPSALGDAALLGEDVVPELEEPEAKGQEEDYGYGNIKKKKTPAYQYILLVVLLVAAAAVLYFSIFSKGGGKAKSVKTVPQKTLANQSPSQKQTEMSPGTTRRGSVRSGTVKMSADSNKFLLSAGGASSSLIDVARSVFNELSKQKQFGALLLDGDRFAVEYVSTTPGLSQQLGKRIQQLLGFSDFKTSPEERHRMDGKVTYWGVISGILMKKPMTGMLPSSTKFSSPDQFVDQMKNLARQNRLTCTVDKKQLITGISDNRQTGFRLRVEGDHIQTLAWLDQLKKFQPTCNIRTLFLVPMDYFDNQANKVKLVLDLSVSFG